MVSPSGMAVQKPTIYLFDIDGTLVSAAGVGRRALQAAFTQRYGHPGKLDFGFDGMTDRTIVDMALQQMDPPIPQAQREAEIDAILDLYVAALKLEAKSAAHQFVVLEGAPAVLDALVPLTLQRTGVVGLGTGNIRKGAEIKLETVGLYKRFAFGGFGCDHHKRAALLAVGAARGAALLGHHVSACRVLVIGDTPKDVAAARDIGATCLAVSTGRFTQTELRASGAHHTAPSLASAEAMRVLLPS